MKQHFFFPQFDQKKKLRNYSIFFCECQSLDIIFSHLCLVMLYIIKNFSAAFDWSHERHLINETFLTWENRPLCVTSPYFNPPPPSMQNQWHRCCWTRQYPLVPFPSLFAQHEVWNLFFDHCFPPASPSLGEKKGPKEEGDGETKRAKSKREGRGAHSHVQGIWRKHTVWLFPINKWCVGQVTCCGMPQ